MAKRIVRSATNRRIDGCIYQTDYRLREDNLDPAAVKAAYEDFLEKHAKAG